MLTGAKSVEGVKREGRGMKGVRAEGVSGGDDQYGWKSNYIEQMRTELINE